MKNTGDTLEENLGDKRGAWRYNFTNMWLDNFI